VSTARSVAASELLGTTLGGVVGDSNTNDGVVGASSGGQGWVSLPCLRGFKEARLAELR
jgi:hypothetical protein